MKIKFRIDLSIKIRLVAEEPRRQLVIVNVVTKENEIIVKGR